MILRKLILIFSVAVALTAAEQDVTLIYRSWNRGEGGGVVGRERLPPQR